MKNYSEETKKRIEFIQNKMSESSAKGIVFGNSGGKDSALVGILCKMACDDTLGVIMPCHSKQNFGTDRSDALELAEKFNIKTIEVNLTEARNAIVQAVPEQISISGSALTNIAPRLRMIALYTVAASENRLVAGTGNKSEIYMGYFTKWGDGAYDFNPIADLTVSEIYEFLEYLGAPENIINKAPSAGLFEGQTDEADMGVAYSAIDSFIVSGEASEKDKEIIERYHRVSAHKRKMPDIFGA